MMTDLRLYQLASAKLLRQFVSLLDKHNLEYWLAEGTLLGAFRHRGFIPWDDDIDLGMERKTYNRLRSLLPKSGFFYQDADAIRILIKGTRVSIDIFAYDRGHSEWLSHDELKFFQDKLLTLWLDNKERLYKRLIVNKLHWSAKDRQYAENISSFYFSRSIQNGFLFQAWHSKLPNEGIFKHSDIYPLGTIEFEGYLYSAPGNVEATLARRYPDYLQIPDENNRVSHGLYKNMTSQERRILQDFIK